MELDHISVQDSTQIMEHGVDGRTPQEAELSKELKSSD